jgi:hypothetical protein
MAWVQEGPLGSFHGRFLQSLDARDADPPARLYHYTTADGARGIVESQTIWGSDARYLNDSGELTYIDKVVATAASELRPQYAEGVAADFLDGATMGLFGASGDRVYVVCFCAHGDQLSQWRGYPRDGRGFALGFDAQTVKGAAPLLLRKVLYDEREQVREVRDVLVFFCDWLSSVVPDDAWRTSLCSLALLEAGHVLAECLFSFKHQAFSEEAEWRLVQVSRGELDDAVQIRTGPFGLVPYIEMRPTWHLPRISPLLPIADVVVGPTPHQALATNAMRTLLTVSGHGREVAVRNSDVPLRV